MAELVIRLFGTMEARLDGAAIPRLWERKGDELLVLLALQSDQEVPTEWLSRMLWPEGDGDMDRLRHSVRALRDHLGPVFGERIQAGPNRYRLSPSPPPGHRLDIDVLAFDRAAVQGGDDDSLKNAVRLYDRGALLEMWQEDRNRGWLRSAWFQREIERRKGQYAEMLEALIRHARCGRRFASLPDNLAFLLAQRSRAFLGPCGRTGRGLLTAPWNGGIIRTTRGGRIPGWH